LNKVFNRLLLFVVAVVHGN